MNTAIINKQRGFTLVEIAIVLVIIGLLLGGILKGQELINSARVRNLADQNAGVQAAYYGFIDRYRQVPGDFEATDATTAIGQTINIPTTATAGNGRIDNTLEEAAAVWEQLAKSNFIGGGFTPATSAPASETAYIDNAPKNAFNGALTLTRNDGYEVDTGSPSVRLVLHLGPNIPVTIARELDVKVDDGKPTTGVLRVTQPESGTAVFPNLHAALAACIDTSGTTDEYDIQADAQDCGVAFLY